MSDLIRRQDIIGYIDRVRNSGLGKKKSLEYISKYVERVPSAEAVEVVRCKDCRHRDLFSCPLTDNDFQKDDDFCSWGERKGGDDE